MSVETVRTACLAHFENGRILCVKPEDKTVFHFVGGKYEEGEDDLSCLIREVREEIGCEIDPKSVEHLGDFVDEAHGGKYRYVLIRLYKAGLIGEPHATSEVREICYIDSTVDPEELTAVASNKVFPWLKENGYIR